MANDTTAEDTELCDITIKEPKGGENYYTGDKITISWEASGAIAFKLKLDIYDDQGTTPVISVPIVNVSSEEPKEIYKYEWTIPDSIIGNNCSIYIDQASGECSDKSKFFFIRKREIKIISPNGGEFWDTYKNQTIQCEYLGNVESVKLEYFSPHLDEPVELVKSSPRSAEYSWKPTIQPIDSCKIRVTDTRDNSVFDESDGFFTICDTLEIVSDELIPFRRDRTDSYFLESTGGYGEITWIDIENKFPWNNLIFDNGKISGKPNSDDRLKVTIEARDNAIPKHIVTKDFKIIVDTDIVITNNELNTRIVGQRNDDKLTAIYGEPPYSWYKVLGNLPLGLDIDSDQGKITGKAKEREDATFSLIAVDAQGDSSAPKEFSISVYNSLNISPRELDFAYINKHYEQFLFADTLAGSRSPVWEVTFNKEKFDEYPLELIPDGRRAFITGDPAKKDSFYFRIKVTDTISSLSDSCLYWFCVKNSDEITITPVDPSISGRDGDNVDLYFEAKNAINPISWDINPPLPDSLNLTAEKVDNKYHLHGDKVKVGQHNFLLTATDKNLRQATKNYRIAFYDTLIITSPSPLEGNLCEVFFYELDVAGDSGTVKYELVRSAVPPPPGISVDEDGVIHGTPSQLGDYHLTVLARDKIDTTTKKFTFFCEPAKNIDINPLNQSYVIGEKIPLQWNENRAVKIELVRKTGSDSLLEVLSESNSQGSFEVFADYPIADQNYIQLSVVDCEDKKGSSERFVVKARQLEKIIMPYLFRLPYGYEQDKYRLISVPLDLDNKSIVDNLSQEVNLLGDDPDCLLYTVKGLEQWDKYSPQKSDSIKFDVGRSFLIISRKRIDDIQFSSGTEIGDIKTEIPLKAGWNLVANPYCTDSLTAKIENLTLDNFYVKSNPDIQIILWRYDGAWNKVKTREIIHPWTGYALQSYFADTLVVEPNWINVDVESQSVIRNDNLTGDAMWHVNVILKSNNNEDSFNLFGIAKDSKLGFDQRDIPEPPPLGKHATIIFRNSNWGEYRGNYCTDFQPLVKEGNYWHFSILSNDLNSQMELTFNGIPRIPLEYQIMLHDLDSNEFFDLRKKNAITIKPSSRDFRLVVAMQEHVSDLPTIIQDFDLLPNYPNPFNPSTTLKFQLPRETSINLKVYNIRGELVRELAHEKLMPMGSHSIQWDGKNDRGENVATGVYLFTLEWENSRIVRKMLLVK